MAQFVFYIDDAERCELFSLLKNDNGIFVKDILYEDDNYKEVETCEDFITSINNGVILHYFFLNNSFVRKKIVLSKNRLVKDAKAFYVNQRGGGPYIDFSFYSGYDEKFPSLLKKSVIELYSRFINENSGVEFNSSEEVRGYYNKIISFVN